MIIWKYSKLSFLLISSIRLALLRKPFILMPFCEFKPYRLDNDSLGDRHKGFPRVPATCLRSPHGVFQRIPAACFRRFTQCVLELLMAYFRRTSQHVTTTCFASLYVAMSFWEYPLLVSGISISRYRMVIVIASGNRVPERAYREGYIRFRVPKLFSRR